MNHIAKRLAAAKKTPFIALGLFDAFHAFSATPLLQAEHVTEHVIEIHLGPCECSRLADFGVQYYHMQIDIPASHPFKCLIDITRRVKHALQ